MVKDQAYRDPSYENVATKNLTLRWTRGHRKLQNTTTYQDDLDIYGNNASDTLVNMGGSLPMDLPPPKPHNIVLHGHTMPSPAKSLIMQLRRQKPMADIHWVSWIPVKQTDKPHGSHGCGIKYAGGARARPRSTSRHSAAPAANDTGGRCKCAWPCVTHGRLSGRNGTSGETSGHHTNPGRAPRQTMKSGCAHTSSSPYYFWAPSPNTSDTGFAQWRVFSSSGRSKASRDFAN